MPTARRLVIVGAGGHATSVAETAATAGYDIVAFIGEPRSGDTRFGVPITAAIPAGHIEQGGALVVAEGDNFTRQLRVEQLGHPVDPEVYPSLVHPSASVSRFATLGAGTVVLQGAVVGAAATVGRFCIINSAASVDHDCVIDDFASIGPGGVLGGAVYVGTRSAICIGAVVKHGIRIGSDSVVGANSYAHVSLPEHSIAFGSPARLRGSRQSFESFL